MVLLACYQGAEFRWETRRAVSGLLEQFVREAFVDFGQVVCQWSEPAVRWCLQQEAQLRLVGLEFVDLLMVKPITADDGLRAKVLLGGTSESGVGR